MQIPASITTRPVPPVSAPTSARAACRLSSGFTRLSTGRGPDLAALQLPAGEFHFLAAPGPPATATRRPRAGPRRGRRRQLGHDTGCDRKPADHGARGSQPRVGTPLPRCRSRPRGSGAGFRAPGNLRGRPGVGRDRPHQEPQTARLARPSAFDRVRARSIHRLTEDISSAPGAVSTGRRCRWRWWSRRPRRSWWRSGCRRRGPCATWRRWGSRVSRSGRRRARLRSRSRSRP